MNLLEDLLNKEMIKNIKRYGKKDLFNKVIDLGGKDGVYTSDIAEELTVVDMNPEEVVSNVKYVCCDIFQFDTEEKLQIQYTLTAIITIFAGLLIVIAPNVLAANQDPLLFGALGCIWLTFGILSILGIKKPLKFLPVLIFQLIYKIIWFGAVVIPVAIQGNLEINLLNIGLIFIFAFLIVGDILFIPFKDFFDDIFK